MNTVKKTTSLPPPSQGTSRTARFAWTLISGNTLMVLTILYSILQVPLALHYISKAEFGLLTLVLQFISYVVLIDMGMTAAIMRTLVDHKDDRTSDRYGSIVLTGALANLVQGILIIVIGSACSLFVAGWFNIGPDLQKQLVILVIGQSIITGGRFISRPMNLMLAANLRQDIVNWIECGTVILSAAILWVALWAGTGIFSILWANGIALVVGIVLSVFACLRMNVLPAKGRWGRPQKAEFWALFTFGRDVFLYILGSQIINASQIILVTRVLGLEAATIWAICIRTYNLIIQFTARICDASGPMLNEMWVRQEKELFLRRFRSLVIVSASMAAFGGVMLALCNQSFVDIWTSGRITWPPINNLLLGAMVILQILTRSYTSLAGQTKNFTQLRYIYFLEAILFVFLALQVLPRWGSTGLIVASMVATCLLSLPMSLRLVSRCFDIPSMQVLFGWSKPMLRLLLFFTPIALANYWLFNGESSLKQFLAYTACAGIPGGLLFLTFGIERAVRNELLQRLPKVGVLQRFARQ